MKKVIEAAHIQLLSSDRIKIETFRMDLSTFSQFHRVLPVAIQMLLDNLAVREICISINNGEVLRFTSDVDNYVDESSERSE